MFLDCPEQHWELISAAPAAPESTATSDTKWQFLLQTPREIFFQHRIKGFTLATTDQVSSPGHLHRELSEGHYEHQILNRMSHPSRQIRSPQRSAGTWTACTDVLWREGLGEKNCHWAPFRGCPAVSQLGGEREGCWALCYLTPTLALALSFYGIPQPLGKRHSESQVINTLPLGCLWRHWLFLRQHNNQIPSLRIFERTTFLLYLSQGKVYLFFCESTSTSTGKTPPFCCTTEFNGGRCYLEIELSLKKIEISQKSCFSCTEGAPVGIICVSMSSLKYSQTILSILALWKYKKFIYEITILCFRLNMPVFLIQRNKLNMYSITVQLCPSSTWRNILGL